MVDAVASLGGIEVEVDEWGIDVCYSGSQKCLSAPPGLAPVSFSSRAVEAMEQPDPEILFEGVDLVADCGGSDVELAGCFAKAAQPGGRFEGAKCAQGRQMSIH